MPEGVPLLAANNEDQENDTVVGLFGVRLAEKLGLAHPFKQPRVDGIVSCKTRPSALQ